MFKWPPIRVALTLCLLALAVFPATAAGQEACGFADGFAMIREEIGAEIVGECVEPPRAVDGGNVEQRTTGGLLVWEKLTNLVAFTDGSHTWVSGPNGVESRLNSEEFAWEKALREEAIVTPQELAFLYIEAVRGRADVALEHIYAEAYVLAMDGLSRWVEDRKAQLSGALSGGLPLRLLPWNRGNRG